MEGDHDQACVPAHGFVDAVIDDFIDAMMEPAFGDIADIHGGASSYVFDVLQYLYVFRGIVLVIHVDLVLSN
jgi:hypothetical protein